MIIDRLYNELLYQVVGREVIEALCWRETGDFSTN
jgi:hypothetical protein